MLSLTLPVLSGDQIEYVLELPSQPSAGTGHVQCFGRVVHRTAGGTGVTIERYHFEDRVK